MSRANNQTPPRRRVHTTFQYSLLSDRTAARALVRYNSSTVSFTVRPDKHRKESCRSTCMRGSRVKDNRATREQVLVNNPCVIIPIILLLLFQLKCIKYLPSKFVVLSTLYRYQPPALYSLRAVCWTRKQVPLNYWILLLQWPLFDIG